jgi:hypothetical protein
MVDRVYVKPTLSDYGTLRDMTLASGTIGNEDGIGKTIQVDAGVAGVSVGVFP